MDYLLAWVLGLAAFFGIVLVLFWLITRSTRALMPGRPSTKDACQVQLERRLANGEISRAEFDEALRILGLG